MAENQRMILRNLNQSYTNTSSGKTVQHIPSGTGCYVRDQLAIAPTPDKTIMAPRSPSKGSSLAVCGNSFGGG